MSNHASPLLETNEVSKFYGSKQVLNGVSLSVMRGEVVVLIGPSGAGKSTFLRTLNQLESIDGGSIYLDGELQGIEYRNNKLVYRDADDVTRQRRKFGMVFQSFNLFPHMTALENIAFAPKEVRGDSIKKAKKEALDLLSRVGLDDHANHYPSELSGGQQQRVAIARALALSPEVLLFDEPTSALDPELVDEVLKVMRDLSSQGQTMIIVTHEMGFARDVANRIVFMTEGAIREIGTPAEIFESNTNERLSSFLGSVGSH